MRRPAARLGTALLVALSATRLLAQDSSDADKARAAAPFHSGPVAVPSAPNPETAVAAETVALSIEHEPLVCLTASRYPRIEARISPAEGVRRAWVRFRSDPDTGWYAVQLAKEGGVHVGLLPAPKGLKTKTFTYFLEASDQSAAMARTSEYSPLVVGDAKACPGGKESASVADAKGLIVDKPPGSSQETEPVPRGFGTRGTVGAIGVFDWSARTTSLISGALIIAGGGTALALSRGHPEGDTSVPGAPTRYNMLFGTSIPPPGSQVSIAHGSLEMRINVTAFVVSVGWGDPPAFIAVDFFGPGSGTPCVEVVSPAHFPNGGLEEFVVSGPLIASGSCSLPFTTSRVTGSLMTADRALMQGTRPFSFDVAYTFVP